VRAKGAGILAVNAADRQSVEFQASRTSLATSLMRAVHSRRDPNPLIDDPWGDRIVPESFRLAYRETVLARLDAASRERALADEPQGDAGDSLTDLALRASPAYAGVITRTRYTEDALRVAVAGGVRQYVIIGAGFDSFALRRPPFARDLDIFEVDHPATQALKRHQLSACAVEPPAGLHFVGADLAGEELDAALARSSFHPETLSFFSWLGVTMYLSREANFATFRAIARCGAPGSELVFTYFDARVHGLTSGPFSELTQRVAALGEPFQSGFDPNTIAADLQGCGLTLEEDIDDREALERIDRADSNDLRPPPFSRIARARIAIRA
jgi:methyltransferase (TIGR00027 family)